MLSPTEKRTVSRKVVAFNLNSLRKAKPGINDKKTKTVVSLRIGMFKKIAMFAKKVIIGIIIRAFLMLSIIARRLNYQDNYFIPTYYQE